MANGRHLLSHRLARRRCGPENRFRLPWASFFSGCRRCVTPVLNQDPNRRRKHPTFPLRNDRDTIARPWLPVSSPPFVFRAIIASIGPPSGLHRRHCHAPCARWQWPRPRTEQADPRRSWNSFHGSNGSTGRRWMMEIQWSGVVGEVIEFAVTSAAMYSVGDDINQLINKSNARLQQEWMREETARRNRKRRPSTLHDAMNKRPRRHRNCKTECNECQRLSPFPSLLASFPPSPSPPPITRSCFHSSYLYSSGCGSFEDGIKHDAPKQNATKQLHHPIHPDPSLWLDWSGCGCGWWSVNERHLASPAHVIHLNFINFQRVDCRAHAVTDVHFRSIIPRCSSSAVISVWDWTASFHLPPLPPSLSHPPFTRLKFIRELQTIKSDL